MPTIFDVARQAGVGIGTVSRVLNGSSLVSTATRERVLDAMRALDYHPNTAARAFGQRRTATIELVVPLYARSFFLDVLHGIHAALAETPYRLLVHTVDDLMEAVHALEVCGQHANADGALLVWLTPTREFVERVTETQFPVVLLNASAPRLSSVATDHARAAETAVEYCFDLGHRRIALVDRPVDPYNLMGSGGICLSGYDRAMNRLGRGSLPGYVGTWPFSTAGGAAAGAEILDRPNPSTAVIVASDIQAIGFLEVARTRGVRVPDDISIVAYNDSEIAALQKLTTVQVPLAEMGRVAAQMLLDAIAQPGAEPVSTVLPTILARRGTCGPPRV
jgi:LacI family transcriptional regulator, galactose operon repressor